MATITTRTVLALQYEITFDEDDMEQLTVSMERLIAQHANIHLPGTRMTSMSFGNKEVAAQVDLVFHNPPKEH